MFLNIYFMWAQNDGKGILNAKIEDRMELNIQADTNTFEKHYCAFRFAIYLLTTQVLCCCSEYSCLKRKSTQCAETICTLSICLYIPASPQIDREHPETGGLLFSTLRACLHSRHRAVPLEWGGHPYLQASRGERERDGKTRRGWERGVLGRGEAYEAGVLKAWWKWLIAGEVRGQDQSSLHCAWVGERVTTKKRIMEFKKGQNEGKKGKKWVYCFCLLSWKTWWTLSTQFFRMIRIKNL